MIKAVFQTEGEWKVLQLKNKAIVEHTEPGDLQLRIIADARVSATVFLTLAGEKVTIEAKVGPEAKLTIICLQESDKKIHIVQRASVAEGGRIHWHNTTLGEAVHQDLVSELSGRNAVSDIDWIFRVRAKGKQMLSARNLFNAQDGGGEITMKGVAEGTGFATVNGMIEIAEAAGGTNTYLTEDVLMLDPTAKIDAIPGLEIRTNDVKASHSATVSRVTAEDLFYMQSRGIEEIVARRLYVEGFLSDLTQRVADSSVRETIDAAIRYAGDADWAAPHSR